MKKRIISLVSALCLVISSYAVTYKEDKTICEGTGFPTFTASAGSSYQWYRNNVIINGATNQSYTPTQDGEYKCAITTTTDMNTGNLVSEGSFDKNCNNYPDRQSVLNEETGDFIQYELMNKTCETNPNNYPTSNFTSIAATPKEVKPKYFKNIRSVDGTDSNMLVCDGAESDGVKVWYARELTIVPGETYRFSCYVANIDSFYRDHGANSLSNLEFRIEYDGYWGDGKQLAQFKTEPIVNHTDLAKWEFHTATYTFPADLQNTTAHIFIWNHNTEGEGNDFAIDEIYFGTTLSNESSEEEYFKLTVDKQYNVKLPLAIPLCPGTSQEVTPTFTDINGDPVAAPTCSNCYDWNWLDETAGAQYAHTTSLTVTPNSTPNNDKIYHLVVDYSEACNTNATLTVTTRTDCGNTTENTYTYQVCNNSPYAISAVHPTGSRTWNNGETEETLQIASVPANTTTTYTCTIVDGADTYIEYHKVTGGDCSSTHNENACLGETKTLTPTFVADDYEWTLPDGTTLRAPSITDSYNEATTKVFKCTAIKRANTEGAPILLYNMMPNGDFEEPQSANNQYNGFTSSYKFYDLDQDFPNRSGADDDKNGYYRIASESDDHTVTPDPTGGNYFLECDGDDYAQDVVSIAYAAKLNGAIEQGKEYQFSFLAVATSNANSANITFRIALTDQNGQVSYEPLSSNNLINNSTWKQFGVGEYWTAPANYASAEVQLINLTKGWGGNDFALDNIMFQEVCRNANTEEIVLHEETFTYTWEACTTDEEWEAEYLKGTETTILTHTTGNAYKWFDQDGNELLDENGQPITSRSLAIVVDKTQKYTCEIDLGNGAKHYEYITINYYLPTELSRCENETAVLKPTLQGTYAWYLLQEDGSKKAISEPTIKNSTVYCEYLTPNKTNRILCSITHSNGIRDEQWNITVHTNPSFEVEVEGRDATIQTDDTFTSLVLDGQMAYEQTWITMLNVGEHTLTMTNAYGCKSIRTFEVVPVPLEPMVFCSPNQDGNFDNWKVKGIDFYPEATVQIYDRYHRLLATLQGEASVQGWDGNYNGHPMPMDDYWYVIMIPETKQQISGHFVLKR